MHNTFLKRCYYYPHFIYLFIIFKDFICLVLERGEEWKKERERNISVCLLLTRPQLKTWPATQACALTGNRTGDSGSQAGIQFTEPHQPGLLSPPYS